MSKNLFETYDVNGETYTDNLGENALIGIPKKQFIEYEQQKEKIERLNNTINKTEQMIKEYWQEIPECFIESALLEEILNKIKKLKEKNNV